MLIVLGKHTMYGTPLRLVGDSESATFLATV